MNFLKRRRILKKCNALDLIPVRICGHTEEDGSVVIMAPKFTWSLTHAFFPSTRLLFYRIRLDSTGSAIWKNIDGKLNLSEITELTQPAAERRPGSDYRDRVIRFITMLYERRYISFSQVMKE